MVISVKDIVNKDISKGQSVYDSNIEKINNLISELETKVDTSILVNKTWACGIVEIDPYYFVNQTFYKTYKKHILVAAQALGKKYAEVGWEVKVKMYWVWYQNDENMERYPAIRIKLWLPGIHRGWFHWLWCKI